MVMYIDPFRFGLVLPALTIPSAPYWRCRALRHPTNTDWIMGDMVLAATAGGATLLTGGTAIASGGSSPGNAFDGSAVTYWKAPFANNGWIGYHATASISPQELRITYPTTTSGQYPIALSLDYSSNGSTWYVFTVFDDTTWTNSQTRSWSFDPALANSSTQWRTYVELNTSGNALAIDVAEIEMASSVSGTNLFTGGTPTGNTDLAPGNVVGNAFDGNATTTARWINKNRSIITYTTAAAVPGKELRVQGSSTAGLNNPGDIRLLLPDGASGAWRVAAETTGLAAWTASEIKSVVVP